MSQAVPSAPPHRFDFWPRWLTASVRYRAQVVNCTRMFTSALRADQYLVVQIKCVVGALNLLESQLATALVAVRRGWWLNKGTHERLAYSLRRLIRTGCPLRNRTVPGRWATLT